MHPIRRPQWRRLLTAAVTGVAAGSVLTGLSAQPAAAATKYVMTAFTNASQSNINVYQSGDAANFSLLKAAFLCNVTVGLNGSKGSTWAPEWFKDTDGTVSAIGIPANHIDDTTTTPAGATAVIKGTESGRCADVPGSNQTSGTRVGLWACNGEASQKWSRS